MLTFCQKLSQLCNEIETINAPYDLIALSCVIFTLNEETLNLILMLFFSFHWGVNIKCIQIFKHEFLFLTRVIK